MTAGVTGAGICGATISHRLQRPCELLDRLIGWNLNLVYALG